jgi:hypothetical protein
MALVVKDRVKQTTTTTGTGNIVLNGNVDGFQTFAAALADGDTTYFGIFVPSTNDYEVGLGTWTEGSATLARTTVLESSNSGSAINITAQAEVFITQPAEKAVFQDANGDVDLGGNKILFGNLYSTTGDLPSASTYHGMFAHVHGTGKAYYAHGGNWIELVNEDTSGNVSMGGNLTVTGDLTVNGTTTTVSTTNTVVKDSLIELGNGTSGSPSNDAGIVIERGSSDNAFIGYDESADKFTVGTGSFTGATTGNLTISTGTLVANVEGNVTGNVTGNTSGTAATVTTAAQPNITSLGTLTTLTVDDITINGSTISDAGDLTIDSGGDIILDANGADWKFKDDGTHVLNIENSSGDIKITSITNDKDIIFRGVDNGSAITALTLDMSDAGTAIFNHDIKLGDSSKAIFGAGSDLQIYHDGSNSYIDDQGTGRVYIRASDQLRLQASDGENYALFAANGAAQFYYDNSQKLATTSTGVDVTGNVTATALTVDEITIDGDTITATDDFTIDVASDIKLDANGGYINFYDNGTAILTFQNSSTDAVIWSRASDRDMIFKGNDGGSVITALTLDMSDGGSATFNNDLYVPDQIIHSGDTDTYIQFNAANTFRVVTGNSQRLLVSNSGVALSNGGLDMNGNNITEVEDIYVRDKIYHDGDTDTYVEFATNTINLYTGGTQAHFQDSGLFLYDGSLAEDYDGLSGTSPTCNVDNGGAFSLTMSGNTTFTFSGAASGFIQGFVLQLTGNGSTVTWPGSVKWAGGTAPDAPANGETDILVFHTRDGGTNWYGVLSSDAAA